MPDAKPPLALKNFLEYYEDELTYLRRLGIRFAKEHGDVAEDLGIALDGRKRPDAHVNSIFEAFAFLAARIHLRLDDDFPQVTSALLDLMYPQFCRPIPSFTMVRFQPDRGATAGQTIPRGTGLTTVLRPGIPIRTFRTCCATEVYPVEIERASWRVPTNLPAEAPETSAILRIRLRCFGDISFSGLKVEALRFYLGADQMGCRLYEAIHSQCHTVRVLGPAELDPKVLPRQALVPVGFSPDESLWPDSARSFRGYEVIEEFFAFPAKFLFFELRGEEFAGALAVCGPSAELEFHIRRIPVGAWKKDLEKDVTAATFRLGCVPAVNLFEAFPEGSIPLTQHRYEHPITAGNNAEVYSVESVVAKSDGNTEVTPLERFYGARAASAGKTAAGYWFAVRRAPLGMRKPAAGTEKESSRAAFTSEVILSVMVGRGNALKSGDTLTVRLLCMNRGEPLTSGSARFQFPGTLRVDCIENPTRSFPAPFESFPAPSESIPAFSENNDLWRLVTQLSLNHKSLVDDGDPATLKSLLSLHNLAGAGNPLGQSAIDGIVGVEGAPDFARVELTERGPAFVRGKRVDIEVDEDQHFQKNEAYLFGAVLDRFLGAWTSMNSFTQLNIRTARREIGEFPPRAGDRVVS